MVYPNKKTPIITNIDPEIFCRIFSFSPKNNIPIPTIQISDSVSYIGNIFETAPDCKTNKNPTHEIAESIPVNKIGIGFDLNNRTDSCLASLNEKNNKDTAKLFITT